MPPSLGFHNIAEHCNDSTHWFDDTLHSSRMSQIFASEHVSNRRLVLKIELRTCSYQMHTVHTYARTYVRVYVRVYVRTHIYVRTYVYILCLSFRQEKYVRTYSMPPFPRLSKTHPLCFPGELLWHRFLCPIMFYPEEVMPHKIVAFNFAKGRFDCPFVL